MAIQLRPATVQKEAQAVDLLCFRLGELTFAIHIAPVIQLIDMVTILPLPHENGMVEGVINVRGGLVPVVDLRRYLSMGGTERELHTPIILASVNGRAMGLIVDEVLGVFGFPVSQLFRSEDFLPSVLQPEPVFDGILTGQSGPRLLLNLDRLFTAERFEVLDRLDEALRSSGELAGVQTASGLDK
jgi:purine-binding chemotaxis protein CheW